MHRSKILAAFLVLALAAAGGLQAASLVPHVHGEDRDHSAHPTCPVHQAQQAPLQAVDAPAAFRAEPPGFSDLPPVEGDFLVLQTRLFSEFLRAPPASF